MNKHLFTLSLASSLICLSASAMQKNELALATKVISATKSHSIQPLKNENVARLFSSSPNKKSKANVKNENQIKGTDSKDDGFDDFLRMAAFHKYGAAGHVLADMYLDDEKDNKNSEETKPTKYKKFTDEELLKETNQNDKHFARCLKKTALGFAAGGTMMSCADLGTITSDLGLLTIMATSGYFLLNIEVIDQDAKDLCKEKELPKLEKNKPENQN